MERSTLAFIVMGLLPGQHALAKVFEPIARLARSTLLAKRLQTGTLKTVGNHYDLGRENVTLFG